MEDVSGIRVEAADDCVAGAGPMGTTVHSEFCHLLWLQGQKGIERNLGWFLGSGLDNRVKDSSSPSR